MLSYIYRLIRDFENLHGVQPNLLYLNELHVEHLKSAFEDCYTLQSIRDVLKMDVVISKEITHPHVSWTQTHQRIAV